MCRVLSVGLPSSNAVFHSSHPEGCCRAAELHGCLPVSRGELQAVSPVQVDRPLSASKMMSEKETLFFGGGLRVEGAIHPSYSLRVIGFGCSQDRWQMHHNICCQLSLGNASIKN